MSIYSHQPNMASNTNHYLVCQLDQDGKLLGKYDHDDDKAACLIEMMGIVQTLLTTDKVKSAFTQIASEFGAKYKTAWFLQEEGIREDKLEHVVRSFLDKFLIPASPTLCISEKLRHRDLPAITHRYKWEEDNFDLSEYKIEINGPVS